MSQRNYSKKTVSIICLFTLGIIIAFFLVGLFFFDIVIILPTLIPLLIIIIVVAIIIRFSWQPQEYCPRCNMPISMYSEFCRNCGLKLLTKCPNCNMYIKLNAPFCNNCGYAFEFFEVPEEEREFEIIEKGSPAPEKANFCPTCGANLKNAENLRFCEFCGSRLK